MNEKTVEPMKAARSDVHAPNELCAAAAGLQELATNEELLTDRLCNETAENFTALMAQVETCRASLAQIEAMARDRVEIEAAYHRENLQSIEALGLPLGA
jgi:predicted RNA-binding Zn ribbon-like protein